MLRGGANSQGGEQTDDIFKALTDKYLLLSGAALMHLKYDIELLIRASVALLLTDQGLGSGCRLVPDE